MFSFFGRFKKVAVVALLLMLPLIMVFVQRRSDSAHNFLAGPFISSGRYVQKALVNLSGGTADFFYRYFGYLKDYDEMLRLRADHGSVIQERHWLNEARAENTRLEELMEMKKRIEGEQPIGARVVARSGAPMTRLLRIDVGTAQGIRRGDGVFGPRGVVGQVFLAGTSASDVLLLSDTSSAVDVLIQRTRARGIVRGLRNADRYDLSVEDFDRLQDIKEGDVVVSAGDGASFPRGIPVGIVTQVKKSDTNMYTQAQIKPFENLATIEEVLVLHRDGENQRPWKLRGIF